MTKVYEIGTIHPCLVVMWGGTHEGTAKRVVNTYTNKPAWFVTVMQSRGKGGKDTYPVTRVKHSEDESFVLL